MKFILHSSALNGSDEVQTLIDRLVDRVAYQVHRIETPDADLLTNSKWHIGARPTRRKILMSAASSPPKQSSARKGPHATNVDIRDLSDAKIADRLAHLPLTVLVENRESDGTLLDIVVEELGSDELRQLWRIGEKITPQAIKIETAGGIGEIPLRIERILSESQEAGHPTRLFVLCDSDIRWPGDNANSSIPVVTKIKDICAKHSIPLHVLQKRNAENYIPDDVFLAVRDNSGDPKEKRKVEIFLRFTQQQRDHFPIKDGLSDEARSAAIAAGLHSTAEEPDLVLLKERIFPKRPRTLLFLKDQQRHHFTAPGLNNRDGINELNALLNNIAMEL